MVIFVINGDQYAYVLFVSGTQLYTVYTVRKFLMTWKGKPKHQVHQYINLCSEEEGCLRVKQPKVT